MTERQDGGLWCHEVLELLDQFVDDALDAPTAAQVAAHVTVCENCSRFGAAYARVVSAMRAPITDASVDERDLWRRIRTLP